MTLAKKRQMEFAAKVFLANRAELQELEPRLAVAEVTGGDFRVTDWVVLGE